MICSLHTGVSGWKWSQLVRCGLFHVFTGRIQPTFPLTKYQQDIPEVKVRQQRSQPTWWRMGWNPIMTRWALVVSQRFFDLSLFFTGGALEEIFSNLIQFDCTAMWLKRGAFQSTTQLDALRIQVYPKREAVHSYSFRMGLEPSILFDPGGIWIRDDGFGLIYCIFIWVFPKIGVPQNGWFIMGNPIKMDILGVPPFKETPIWKVEYLVEGATVQHERALRVATTNFSMLVEDGSPPQKSTLGVLSKNGGFVRWISEITISLWFF